MDDRARIEFLVTSLYSMTLVIECSQQFSLFGLIKGNYIFLGVLLKVETVNAGLIFGIYVPYKRFFLSGPKFFTQSIRKILKFFFLISEEELSIDC